MPYRETSDDSSFERLLDDSERLNAAVKESPAPTPMMDDNPSPPLINSKSILGPGDIDERSTGSKRTKRRVKVDRGGTGAAAVPKGDGAAAAAAVDSKKGNGVVNGVVNGVAGSGGVSIFPNISNDKEHGGGGGARGRMAGAAVGHAKHREKYKPKTHEGRRKLNDAMEEDSGSASAHEGAGPRFRSGTDTLPGEVARSADFASRTSKRSDEDAADDGGGPKVSAKASVRAPPQRMESMTGADWLGESATFLGGKIQADEVKVRAREVERKAKGSVFTVPSYNVGKANRFRAQYDPQLWSTYMFTYHGTVFPHIILRVVMLTLFAAAVCAYDHYVYELPMMTTTMHQIAGAALSLFITFRTNSSYTRFYEAVHVIGLMTTVAQQCARQVLILARGSNDRVRDSKVRIMRLLSVFPLACKRDLRAVLDKDELEHIWNDEAFLRLIREVRDVPSAIVQAVGYHLHRIAREGAISEASALHIDTSLIEMAKHWASLHKISSHPVPYVFAIEGSRMTVAFILTLPWVLVPYFGWYTVLAIFLFSYELLAIEAIGAEIEDPVGLDFNDLPLEHMVFKHMEMVTQLATAHEILRDDHPTSA